MYAAQQPAHEFLSAGEGVVDCRALDYLLQAYEGIISC